MIWRAPAGSSSILVNEPQNECCEGVNAGSAFDFPPSSTLYIELKHDLGQSMVLEEPQIVYQLGHDINHNIALGSVDYLCTAARQDR
jgi:hypothetical protein